MKNQNADRLSQVLIITLKNLDLVLYSEKDFCWTVSDIRCALQEDNGNSMNPNWGWRKTKDGRGLIDNYLIV